MYFTRLSPLFVLRSMSSDLVVAGAAGGAVFEINATEDGVFAVTGADFKNGFLNLFFATLILMFDFLLVC